MTDENGYDSRLIRALVRMGGFFIIFALVAIIVGGISQEVFAVSEAASEVLTLITVFLVYVVYYWRKSLQ